MVQPIEVIDALPDQIRAGIEGGYRWLLVKVDSASGEDFPVYARDARELARLRAGETDDQYIATEIELTGSVEAILQMVRAGG